MGEDLDQIGVVLETIASDPDPSRSLDETVVVFSGFLLSLERQEEG